MELFLPVINLLLLILSVLISLRFGSHIRRHECFLLPLLTFIILFVLSLSVRPYYIWSVNTFKYYLFFGTFWVAPFSVSFFLLASFPMKRNFTRSLLHILAGVLFTYYFLMNLSFFIPFKAYDFDNRCDIDNVCIQTTHYTCGAASMVNLLSYYGIDAHEGEMASISKTIPGRGVGDAGILYALSKKMNNSTLTPVLVLTTIEELKNIRIPVITTFRLNALIDHAVVIERFQDGVFTVIDPASGIEKWPAAELEDKWNRMAIFYKPTIE